MRRFDLRDPAFRTSETAPAGFRVGAAGASDAVGAEHIGVNLYEIPPGEAVCPLHWEVAEEEWAMALDGPMWVRDATGTHRFEALELAFFPRGPEGVHQVRNDGEATVRVLMLGERSMPGATVYPDSGKVGVWSKWDDADGTFEISSKVPYHHGETSSRD